MKKINLLFKNAILAIFFIVTIAFFASTTNSNSEPLPTGNFSYKYKTVALGFKTDNTFSGLNTDSEGLLGWELVSVVQLPNSPLDPGNYYTYMLCFKKPL